MEEDENKPEHFMQKHVREKLEKVSEKERIYKETVEMLQTEERFVNYFKQYHPLCIEGFIKYYATTKAARYEYAEVMKKNRERKDNQFNILAEWALFGILRHKVFELKSKWDKGFLKNEGVIHYDFSEWEEDPFTCPYIEPVNYSDIERFLDFYDKLWKEQDEYIAENGDPDDDDYYEDDEDGFYFSKDHVDRLKEISYRFDKYMHGGGEYWQRPNYGRALKEGQWMHAARMEEKLKNTPPPAIVPPVVPEVKTEVKKTKTKVNKPVAEVKKTKTKAKDDTKKKATTKAVEPIQEVVQPTVEQKHHDLINDRRPFLNGIKYDEYEYGKFIKKFETHEVYQNFKTMHRFHDKNEFTERIEMDLIVLNDAREHVPIQSHDDWRRAVSEACETFMRKKVREAIITWWEVYNEILLSGKKYEYINTMPPKKFDKTIREKLIEEIKRGRELAGEPGDMDY